MDDLPLSEFQTVRQMNGENMPREWTVYWNEDGEPWAIFLEGHQHDLRTLKSITCKGEIRQACGQHLDDDHGQFDGNLNIGRWWIRLHDEETEDGDPEHPWQFCEKDEVGAVPITGAKF